MSFDGAYHRCPGCSVFQPAETLRGHCTYCRDEHDKTIRADERKKAERDLLSRLNLEERDSVRKEWLRATIEDEVRAKVEAEIVAMLEAEMETASDLRWGVLSDIRDRVKNKRGGT